MKFFRFFRFLINWKFWLNTILLVGLAVGLMYWVFNYFLKDFTRYGQSVDVPEFSTMNIQEAVKMLDSLKLDYEIDSAKYFKDKPIYSILDFYPRSGSKIKPGRRVFLMVNPSSERPIELPNLVQNSFRLARTQLKIANLELGDTIYEPDIAKNVVLRMLYDGKQINPGTLVPYKSKIDLVLGRGPETDIPVPDIKELYYSEALSNIKRKKFTLGRIQFFGPERDTANAIVYYQFPLPGEPYEETLPVDIWLTNYPMDSLSAEITRLNKEYRVFTNADSLQYEDLIDQAVGGTSRRGLDDETRAQLSDDAVIQRINDQKETEKSQGTRTTRVVAPDEPKPIEGLDID